MVHEIIEAKVRQYLKPLKTAGAWGMISRLLMASKLPQVYRRRCLRISRKLQGDTNWIAAPWK